ncbi:MAG: nucleotidyltransferase domain-containing protein [Cyanobacteria bacterium J06629_9]
MLIDLSDLVKDRLSTSQQQIDDFCQHWKIARLSLFGSVLREDFGPDSDIDVLYLFLPNHAGAGRSNDSKREQTSQGEFPESRKREEISGALLGGALRQVDLPHTQAE